MAYSHYLILLILITYAHSIAISVSSQKERCMIVSSNDKTQLLKVDLKFSQFEAQAIEEGYRVVLHDTQTHEQQVFQVQYGTFRKEFPLTENVVYRLCFKIVLTNYRVITKLVDYHVALKHHFNTAEQSIKVPLNLLRSKDLTQTYQYMDKTKELIQKIINNGDIMRKQQSQVFETQKETMGRLQWVSVIELLVIVVFGCYQYGKVKKIIENKRLA